MSLRRVIRHFRSLEWTAFGLDFVIVVAGVFIGIQVSNWNSARLDQAREQRYLVDVAADLRNDIGNFAEIRASAIARISALNYILGEALGEPPPAEVTLTAGSVQAGIGESIPVPAAGPFDKTRLDLLWSDARAMRVYDLNNATFDTLTSTGDMSIIRDRARALAIAQYYQTVHNLIEFQNETLRPFGRNAMLRGIDLGLAAFAPNDSRKVVRLARDNEAFAALLRTERAYTALYLAVIAGLKERAEALVADIGPVTFSAITSDH